MKRKLKIGVFCLFTTLFIFGCDSRQTGDMKRLADPNVEYVQYELQLRQELINDAPIGPGELQLSEHCPTKPGNWFQGSGRSTARSNIFGELSGLEVYCVNTTRSELSGGLGIWTDLDGDTITTIFGVKLLEGFAYEAAPSAPMIGFAQFTGGTGKWAGITGDAMVTGKQNGDGTASLEYRGTIYRPQ